MIVFEVGKARPTFAKGPLEERRTTEIEKQTEATNRIDYLQIRQTEWRTYEFMGPEFVYLSGGRLESRPLRIRSLGRRSIGRIIGRSLRPCIHQ